MPRLEHIPALLLGEPVLSSANPALQWPSKTSNEPCQCTRVYTSAHQCRGEGLALPNIWPQHRNPALSTNIHQKVSKLSESKLRPRCTEVNAKVNPDFCRDSTSPIAGSGSAVTNLIIRLLFQIQQYFQHNYSSTRLSVQVLEDL